MTIKLTTCAVQSSSELNEKWQRLCETYLPVKQDDSIWRLSGPSNANTPEQGWKLHVSATILTACAMFERVAPYLARHGIQFKAPASLDEIQRLNSGLDYSYTQIGKLLTVYPKSSSDAQRIGRQLHLLTSELQAPSIPFEKTVSPGSCVYYRYGAFHSLTIENEDGTKTPALKDPNGQLVPDSRTILKPDWVEETLFSNESNKRSPVDNPLSTRYRVLSAVTQRGKGGVYQAIDMSHALPRACIIKEGRFLGELSWDGRDGVDRVWHEEKVLKALRVAGVPVPEVLDSFRIKKNYYLVTEYVRGETVLGSLLRRKRRLALRPALRLASELAKLVAQIHVAGWTWRDCKPENVIIQGDGCLRPIDFEGACMNKSPDHLPWGTRGFTPPVWKANVRSRQFEDLYALGATLYLLLTGRLREGSDSPSISRLRRNVPATICEVVEKLLSPERCQQLSAVAVYKFLLRTTNDL